MKETDTISSAVLPVMEVFYTLQGEGRYQGQAAYFIRLGGCDVGCVWCDVKESWDVNAHPKISVEKIVAGAVESVPVNNEHRLHHPPIAVITGGEPLLHPLDELTSSLKKSGFRTHLETSGSSPLSGDFDWICLSPKKFKAPLPEVIPVADELKIIIYNKSDFAWGEQYAAQTKPGCRLYLQPEWSKAAVVTPMIIDYIKAHPQWQLSLQVHKYVHIP